MTDDELLARLARMFERFDPVPADLGHAVARAGRLAGTGTTALALVADGSAAGVRGGGRVLGFAGPAGRIDVAVDGDGVTCELTGLATVAGPLWVRWPGDARPVDVDEWGRFAVAGLPAGPLSLLVAGTPDAVGPWFVG
jgi:hypothetical protein